jgi:hypothetical protein
MTFAPACAKRVAKPKPMPLVEPVTTAQRPRKLCSDITCPQKTLITGFIISATQLLLVIDLRALFDKFDRFFFHPFVQCILR